MQQAIIWSNVAIFYCRIHASLGLNELYGTAAETRRKSTVTAIGLNNSDWAGHINFTRNQLNQLNKKCLVENIHPVPERRHMEAMAIIVSWK